MANPKRRILPLDEIDQSRLEHLSRSVTYAGNPEHKRNPGDFGLRPPNLPRQGARVDQAAMSNFSIKVDWEVASNEPPEIAQTAGLLAMSAGDEVLTRNVDNWSRTVRNEARLSAYPMALWFAQSWWRLRHEVLPLRQPTHAWRMGHELSAAGYGYLWPQLLFASEGEQVNIWSIPTRQSPETSTQYLAGGVQAVDALEFERSMDQFISATIARLDSVSCRATTLHGLWAEVLAERSDPELQAYRRFEAMLGYDPDECPEALINQFAMVGRVIGVSALDELAPVCASEEPLTSLDQVRQITESSGLQAKIDQGMLNLMCTHKKPDGLAAWEKGQLLADRAREYLGLNDEAISDTQLCDMLRAPAEVLQEKSQFRMSVGLAIRQKTPDTLSIYLRKRSRTGRRFEISRILADHVVAPERDNWLPVTDAKTSRQKLQRAFAAEFLAPVAGIRNYLQNDFSIDALEEAADYFGVATLAIQTQLVNSGQLQPEVLDGRNAGFSFPYKPGVSPARLNA